MLPFLLGCACIHPLKRHHGPAVLTLRVPLEVKERLDKMAEATHRSKSFLGGEAIQRFLDIESWQIEETVLAIAEAEAGDFAPAEEVNAIVSKYGD